MTHTIDRTPNKDAGKPVTGNIIIPDAFGIYEVTDVDTGKHGAMMIFEVAGKKLQILIGGDDLQMMAVVLNELISVISAKDKPKNPLEVH